MAEDAAGASTRRGASDAVAAGAGGEGGGAGGLVTRREQSVDDDVGVKMVSDDPYGAPWRRRSDGGRASSSYVSSSSIKPAEERRKRRRRSGRATAATASSSSKCAARTLSSRVRANAFGAVLRDDVALATVARMALGMCDPTNAELGRFGVRERLGVSQAAERSTPATGAERCERATIRTRYQGDWLDVGGDGFGGEDASEYLDRWAAAPFEPYSGRRKDCVYGVAAPSLRQRRGAATLMREISREYNACGLGRHDSMLATDESGLFLGCSDDENECQKSTAELYGDALSAFAQIATEMVKTSATKPCVLYVVIDDDAGEIETLGIMSLAAHVVSAAMRSCEKSLLSITTQAIPSSWCEESFSWSSTDTRAMAFNLFLKISRPAITRWRKLNDEYDFGPKSDTDASKTEGRLGVGGASVVGRREPHPLFKTPETATGRNAPAFPTYEPLYVLRDDGEEISTWGLHCAYIIVASRWMVASWSDARGEFFNLEAEPFDLTLPNASSRMDAAFEWLLERTSALSEQLSFAYGVKASERLRFDCAVICRLGATSADERASLERASASPSHPLAPERLTRVEMSCFEPEHIPRSLASFVSESSTNLTYVTAVSGEASVKAYALPCSKPRSHRATTNTEASSVEIKDMNGNPSKLSEIRELSALYASKLSQLSMLCLYENAVTESASVRAPLPAHAEACVNFAGALQAMEANLL